MSDFLASLKLGVASAQEALSNHRQIDGVIEEVNEQILTYTDGKICIYKQVEKTLYKIDEAPKMKIASGDMSVYFLSDANGTLAPVRIFRIDRDREGYPCDFTFLNESVQCFDATALKNALSAYLASQEFGSKLLSLL